ncbi:uncharacterized protein [Antedon mediterranea]|uniref:uncharacterized protein n=1 Tax=Antedon mediterranea TaxID=105859 RepID=UPI003AF5622F
MVNNIDDPNMRIVIHEDNQHARRYNPPTGNEVAILMPNEPCMNRDIVLHEREGGLRHVSELHRAYDTLQYPILFMHGTDGYSIYLHTDAGRKITQMQYYRYHMMCRPTNHLLYCRRLFQQYIVDVFCKIETERLQYLRREQKSLRADSYQNFRDSILAEDSDPRTVGQRIILPSSYTGGPRYMHERQQDSITYIRAYGRPSLFITTTTNPKWKEIVNNLLPNQNPNDRPDIVVHVLHLKLKHMMNLFKNGFFGKLQAWLYSVEFQKRGLPHAHILLWLQSGSKINPQDMDSIISAEIPSPTTEPTLHNLVKSHMIHGPCGQLKPNNPCMKDNHCTKHFPKEFQQNTVQGNDSYPKYKRSSPEDG